MDFQKHLEEVTQRVKAMAGPIQSQKFSQAIEYWEGVKGEYPGLKAREYRIPDDYARCSFDNFKGDDRLVSRLKRYKGGNVILSGNTGVGKTHLAIAMLRHTEEKEWNDLCQEYIDTLKAGVEITKRGKNSKCFLKVPELLLEIRDSFNHNSDISEMELLDCYSYKSFLILDDLGSEKITDFSISTLSLLIDRRDGNSRNTIITTNMTLAEIDEKLNARIASRLSRWINVKIDMPDYRKTRN